MKVKKLWSMLLAAAVAVTVLTGCGGAKNYSAEAAKAANAAQGAVTFEADTALTRALRDALEDHVQTSDVKAAMAADDSLKDLLTSGYQLDVLAVKADSAKAAAEAIAGDVAALAAGKQDKGKIAMVLADNGYYYAAVLTYQSASGGPGSGDDGGSGEDEPTPPPAPAPSVTVNGTKVEAGRGEVTFNVEKGSLTVEVTKEEDGSLTVTITPTPAEGYMVDSVTVDGDAIEAGADGTYTVTVQGGANISVVFESKGYTVDDNGNYTVTNANGLKAWAEAMATSGKYNIDCTLENSITVTDWNAVGAQNPKDKRYTGTFDGNGKTITVEGTLSGSGFFGFIAPDGQVNDLNLDVSKVTISDSTHAGALAGQNCGTIQNCSVTAGTITASSSGSYVGGIAGNNNKGTMIACTVKGGNISGNYAGGIAGRNYEGTINNCQVNDASVNGGAFAGGIVGSSENGASTIGGCIVTDSTINGKQYAGGIAGHNSKEIKGCQVTACTISNDKAGDGTAYGAGGVVGNHTGGEIAGCIVNGGSVTGGGNVGGIVGVISRKTVKGCAAVDVDVSGEGYVGAASGRSFKGGMTSCYWSGSLEDASGYGGSTDASKVTDWTEAISAMNSAISGSGFSYRLDGGVPVLDGSAASTVANTLLRTAQMFGL